MRSVNALPGAAIVMALMAAVISAVVAVHELSYAGNHPYAYGPAKVIAWCGGAGALLGFAVAGLALTVLRGDA